MPSDSRRPSYAILIAISAVGPLALNIFMPSLPGLQQSFGVTYGTAQLTLTLYLIGMAVCQLLYGPLSDRFGRRPMLLIGMSIFVGASLLAALSHTIELLLVARLLQAVGGASGLVLGRAMVRDVFDRARSASVISYITMAFVVAPMVAPVIGGFLDGYTGWRGSFWLLTGVGSLVLAAAWLTLPETHTVQARSASHGFVASVPALLRLSGFRAYALTLTFASGVFFAFLGGAPHIMVDVLHRTPFEYGQWFILVSAGYMLGNAFSGYYSQKLGIDRIILVGNALTLVGGSLCLAAALSGLLSPATVFVPMAVAAMGNGLTIPNCMAGAISVDARYTGAAAGLAGFLQMAFGALTSQLVGSLQADWPFTIFWFMAGASLVSIMIHLRAMQRLRVGNLSQSSCQGS